MGKRNSSSSSSTLKLKSLGEAHFSALKKVSPNKSINTFVMGIRLRIY
jgi:hypothetical protein